MRFQAPLSKALAILNPILLNNSMGIEQSLQKEKIA
jgi:hypothetical protein